VPRTDVRGQSLRQSGRPGFPRPGRPLGRPVRQRARLSPVRGRSMSGVG
jgi:hypothetical protein